MEAQHKPEGLKDYRQAVERSGTPAKADDNISPEGAAECSVTPSGFGYTAPVSRGLTPACDLNTPSGLMEAQQKPEGLTEDDGEYQSSRQAVERSGTPAKADGNISPEGATECSATPSGFGYLPAYLQGFHPCLWSQRPFGATPEMCIVAQIEGSK